MNRKELDVIPVRHLAGVALATALIGFASSNAGATLVPRTVFLEDFGFYTCPYCPESRTAVEQLTDEYSRDDLVAVEYFVFYQQLPFYTTDSAARGSYYGVTGTPTAYFDGYDPIIGGGVDLYPYYAPIVANHLTDLGKLQVDAHVAFDEVADTGSITVNVEVAPGETITNANECKIRVVIYEDAIPLCCYQGRSIWNHVVRDVLPDTQLTVANGGQIQTFTQNFTLLEDWTGENLHAIAWVQRDTNRRQLNAGHAANSYDVSVVDFDPVVQKVALSTTAVWDKEITYTGVVATDVEIALDETSLAPGWDAEIVWNSTTYGSSLTIPGMTPSQLEAVQIRVIPPAGAPGLGSVDVSVTPVGGELQAVNTTIHSFAGTPAILFVDDDNSTAFDVEYTAAIAASGHFAVRSDFDIDGVLPTSYFSLYDAVVWNTGELATQTLGNTVQANLGAYLDGGGALFLSSQGFLNHMGGSAFRQTYLKVADGWAQDAGCATATGVAADPIGDGLVLSMAYPFTDASDRITAQPGAVIWLNAPANGAGIRYDSGTFRTVFMSAAFEGVSDIAGNPNNQATLMGRILDWLAPSTSTGVGPIADTSTALALGQNAPNPFEKDTSVRFVIPASGPVNLTVYDVAGRRVVTLVDRALEAGSHAIAWDGRDAGGSAVASGVYLYRLEAGGRSLTKEMVRLK
jgi:hypothetical protein